MDPNLPEEFVGFYDEEKYKKSQKYTIDNTRFGFFASTFNIIIILLLILYGGFNWIDLYIREYNFESDIIFLKLNSLDNSNNIGFEKWFFSFSQINVKCLVFIV